MFSRKTGPDGLPAAMTSSAGSSGTFSILGADLVVKGDITATADLHVDGRIEGDIACAALVQGQASEIRGAIRAQSARFSGTVHGAIEAGELVILRTARIHGDVTYDALTIEQGAQVDGRFSHRVHVAEEPSLTLVNP